jgi:hypothetical protein
MAVFVNSPADLEDIEVARFDDLHVQSSLLLFQNEEPGSPSSIHVSSLLAAIHMLVTGSFEQQANLQGMPNLYRIFSDPGFSIEALIKSWETQVSTLQAPVFDMRRVLPSFNLRRLGPLACITYQFTPLDIDSFDHSHEVLAINPTLATPEASNLYGSFHYMGLHLKTHFIILFKYTVPAVTSPLVGMAASIPKNNSKFYNCLRCCCNSLTYTYSCHS